DIKFMRLISNTFFMPLFIGFVEEPVICSVTTAALIISVAVFDYVAIVLGRFHVIGYIIGSFNIAVGLLALFGPEETKISNQLDQDLEANNVDVEPSQVTIQQP